MCKLIIAGGRDFGDFALLTETVDTFIEDHIDEDITVVCGMARGADRLGERYAELHGLRVLKQPADWDYYGKSAGFRRNEQMASNATHLIAFWDGESRGTKHMIEAAHQAKLETVVVAY